MNNEAPAWRALALRAVLFAGVGTLCWWALILLELLTAGGGSAVGGVLGEAVGSGLLLSLICTGQVAALWILEHLQRRRGRLVVLGFQLVIIALVAPWAWDQAAFLSSGDGVSGHWWSWILRLGLLAGGAFAALALINWHLQTVARLAGLPRAAARWWQPPWWVLTAAGVAGASGLFFAVVFRLQAYAFFAQALLVPLWLLTTTVIAGPLQRLKVAALVAGLLLIGAAGWSAIHDGDVTARFGLLRESRLAGLTRRVLAMEDPRHVARFDLTNLQQHRCAPRSCRVLAAPLPGTPDQRRNVILISVDALRRDALDWQVDGRPLMPHLREFIEKGVHFRDASTSYTSTAFAVGSAFTGLAASQVLLAPRRPSNLFTLAGNRFDQRFAILPSSGFFKLPAVDQLFLQGTPAARMNGAKRQTRRLMKLLQKARRKNQSVLAWIHYFEPHAGYRKHKAFDFGDSPKQRYMSELAHVDRYLGQLFRTLSRHKYYTNSLVLVFSDHGEALGEHGYHGHSVHLNRWIGEIVLAARAPGLEPRGDDRPAMITDITPTVLHYAGLPIPSDLDGRSLLAPADPERLVVGESFPFRGTGLFRRAAKRYRTRARIEERIERFHVQARKFEPSVSLTDRHYRLIMHRQSGLTELYDRRRDPGEDRDLSAERPEVLRGLVEKLEQWHVDKSRWLHCRIEANNPKESQPPQRKHR